MNGDSGIHGVRQGKEADVLADLLLFYNSPDGDRIFSSLLSLFRWAELRKKQSYAAG